MKPQLPREGLLMALPPAWTLYEEHTPAMMTMAMMGRLLNFLALAAFVQGQPTEKPKFD